MLLSSMIDLIINRLDDLLWPAHGGAPSVIIFSGPKPSTYRKHGIVPETEPNTNPFPNFTRGGGKRSGFSENGASRVVHVKL